jgi:hypothetical protein
MDTPRLILDLLDFAVALFLILFGITLTGVGGYFFVRLFAQIRRGKPFQVFEQRASAALQAADLGWVAIACGPVLGFFISLITVSILVVSPAGESDRGLVAAAGDVMLTTGLGLVAGTILASAFWISSALVGKVRKSVRPRGTAPDPEFDGRL